MGKAHEEVLKEHGIKQALISGLKTADKIGYTFQYDIAICIQSCLDKAGFDIVRKRRDHE